MAQSTSLFKIRNLILLLLALLPIYFLILYNKCDVLTGEIPLTSPTISVYNSGSTSMDINDEYKEQLTWALKPENRKITLLINSCGRIDLLNITITSLMKYWPHDRYPLYEKILIDDSRKPEIAKRLIDLYYPSFEIVLTANNDFEKEYENRDESITLAMDKIFKQITTPWVYHIEDDWQFMRYGFLDESFDIFETNIDGKYHSGTFKNTFPFNYRFMDYLFWYNESIDEQWNGKPMDHFYFNPQQKYSIVLCWNKYNMANWVNRSFVYEYKDSKWYEMLYFVKHGVMWGGFSFNSGLMLTDLYNKYVKKFHSQTGEWGVSQKLIDHGFKVALLGDAACDHIGKKRHVDWKAQ